MAVSLHNKLRLKENDRILAINAPASFKNVIQTLPIPVKFVRAASNCSQVHWFVQDKSTLEKQAREVLGMLDEDVLLWLYFPKASSGLQTDLSRDNGWELLIKKEPGLHWISLVSFDKTWSASALSLKPRKAKPLPPPERMISQYTDPAKKTVRLPSDLVKALQKSKAATVFFDQLSFTNKKEYVAWVITAQREATRIARLTSTIEKLEKGLKNPADKGKS